MVSICIFTGARPNFVKVAPLIRAIQKTEACDYLLVYAGKADDPTLEGDLFECLEMPRPDAFLGVDCENLNELTGQVMAAFDHYLDEHAVDTVIVVDDLASTMATADPSGPSSSKTERSSEEAITKSSRTTTPPAMAKSWQSTMPARS